MVPRYGFHILSVSVFYFKSEVTVYLAVHLHNGSCIGNSGILEGLPLRQWLSNAVGVCVLDSTKGALWPLDTAFTYLGSKYFISMVK